MPLWLRKILAAFSFFQFFAAGLIFGVVVFPILRLVLVRRDRHRAACTRLLHRAYPFFLWWMRFARLIDFERIALPADVPRDRACILAANHPSLIDSIFAVAWFRAMTCVVKARW